MGRPALPGFLCARYTWKIYHDKGENENEKMVIKIKKTHKIQCPIHESTKGEEP
jgi:hypothetical protein